VSQSRLAPALSIQPDVGISGFRSAVSHRPPPDCSSYPENHRRIPWATLPAQDTSSSLPRSKTTPETPQTREDMGFLPSLSPGRHYPLRSLESISHPDFDNSWRLPRNLARRLGESGTSDVLRAIRAPDREVVAPRSVVSGTYSVLKKIVYLTS
jgi:hypothetical protein